MILLVAFLVVVALVPPLGGRLRNLAALDLQRTGLLLATTVLQAVITTVELDVSDGFKAGIHVLSYLLVGGFLWANRAVPWLWLAALGGAMNFLAIVANGGVMPASEPALRSAGFEQGSDFANSAYVEDARLAFLGDVFAVPESMPLSNVFSVGDVVLLAGGAMVVHSIAGSRLARPRGRREDGGGDGGVGPADGGAGGTGGRGGRGLPGSIASRVPLLRDNREFRRLWLAGATSDLGDWTYSLAVIAVLATRGASTGVFAALLVVQMVASSLVGVLGTPIVDRVDRMRLLSLTNLAQALAVASLLVPSSPTVAHFLVVGGLLGGLGALVRPATMAAIPNLVRPDQLVVANGFVAAAFNVAVSLGPIIGAGVVARWGVRPAFTVNVVSFLVSAVLVARIVRQEVPAGVGQAPVAPPPQRWLASAGEGLRHIAGAPVLRGLVLMLVLVVFGAAVRGPVEPQFIVGTLGASTGAIGALAGLWGLGMVVGSTLALAGGRRWSLEHVLVGGIGLLGVSVLVASQAGSVAPVAVLWLLAGTGNALGSVAYETLLQQRTPDELRGRVFGVADAMLDATYLLGALAAVLVTATIGLRAGIGIGGATALAAAAWGALALARRRDPGAVAVPAARPEGRPLPAPAVPHLLRQEAGGTPS